MNRIEFPKIIDHSLVEKLFFDDNTGLPKHIFAST